MVSSTVVFDKKSESDSSATPVDGVPAPHNDSSTTTLSSSMPFSSNSACSDTASVRLAPSGGGVGGAAAAAANDDPASMSLSEQKILLLFPKCKPRSECHYVMNSASASASVNGNGGGGGGGGVPLHGSTHSLSPYAAIAAARSSPTAATTTATGAGAASKLMYIDKNPYANNNSSSKSNTSSSTNYHAAVSYSDYSAVATGGSAKELPPTSGGKAFQLSSSALAAGPGGSDNNNQYNGSPIAATEPAAGMMKDKYSSNLNHGTKFGHSTGSKGTADIYSFYYNNQPPPLSSSPTESYPSMGVGGGGGGAGGLLLSEDDDDGCGEFVGPLKKHDPSQGASIGWVDSGGGGGGGGGGGAGNNSYCHLSVSHYPSGKQKGGGVTQPVKQQGRPGYKPISCYNMVLQSPLEDESDIEDKLKYFNYQHEMQSYGGSAARKDKLLSLGRQVVALGGAASEMHCGGGVHTGMDGISMMGSAIGEKMHEKGQPLGHKYQQQQHQQQQHGDGSLEETLISASPKGIRQLGQKFEHVVGPHVGLSVAASPSAECDVQGMIDFANRKSINHSKPTEPTAIEQRDSLANSGSNIIEYDGSPRRFGLNLCDDTDYYLASSVKINLTSSSMLALPRPGFPQRIVPAAGGIGTGMVVSAASPSANILRHSPSLLDQVNSSLNKTVLFDSKVATGHNDPATQDPQDPHNDTGDTRSSAPSVPTLEKIRLSDELGLTDGSGKLSVPSPPPPPQPQPQPLTSSSTFDYLYEFSETRKVLEEFFKCPSTEDVEKVLEKFSDFNDSGDDPESLDVQYEYPVELERVQGAPLETTYIGTQNGTKPEARHMQPGGGAAREEQVEEDEDEEEDEEEGEEEDEEEDDDDDTAEIEDEEEDGPTERRGEITMKYKYHPKRNKAGTGPSPVSAAYGGLRRKKPGGGEQKRSHHTGVGTEYPVPVYKMASGYPESTTKQQQQHQGDSKAFEHNELYFSSYINSESRTSSCEAIHRDPHGYEANGGPLLANGTAASIQPALDYGTASNGTAPNIDGRKGFVQQKYSKNFNYSPDTTDYDSNCGDYDSEISPQYGSDFGLITGSGHATMCEDLNNGVISATSGGAPPNEPLAGCQFGGSGAANYTRYYAAMPVLEDGLSSGHVSDSDNNLTNISLSSVALPPDLVPSVGKLVTAATAAVADDMIQQSASATGYGLGNTFRMSNVKLNSSMLHSATIFKNRDPELESLYTINTIQSTPPPPAPAPHRKSSIDCDSLSTQQPQHSQSSAGIDVQSTLKDIRICLQRSRNLSMVGNMQQQQQPLSGKAFEKGTSMCTTELADSIVPSLSPIWIPRSGRESQEQEQYGSKPQGSGAGLGQSSGAAVSVGGQAMVCKPPAALGPKSCPEENELFIQHSGPDKDAVGLTGLTVDDEEDPDTDLETDRLLGHQRLDDHGFYDEKQKMWCERKAIPRMMSLGKLSSMQQTVATTTTMAPAATGLLQVTVSSSANGVVGGKVAGAIAGGTRAAAGQLAAAGVAGFLPGSASSTHAAVMQSSGPLPELVTSSSPIGGSVVANGAATSATSGATSVMASSATNNGTAYHKSTGGSGGGTGAGNLITFNGPNDGSQAQVLGGNAAISPSPSPQHSLSGVNLLDKSNGSGSPSGSTKSKMLHQETKRKSKNKEGKLRPAVLIEGVLFRARYLGSTQLVCEGQPTKSTRMLQAEEAVSRIKALSPDGEAQPSTEVDLFISTEKIMVLNTDLKEIMMDHALRTISYIADIGDLVVLMARRRFVPQDIDSTDSSGNGGGGGGGGGNGTALVAPHIIGGNHGGTNGNASTPAQKPSTAGGPKGNRTPKMICHVFESEEAQFIAQSIGQAFQVAYMEFLKANGIEDHSFMKEMDYQEVLNSQEIFGDELEIFAKKELQKEVVVPKAKGEILGVVIVESGWGSMLPTVVIANLASSGAAARCGQLNIGDQIIAINGLSLVGLPLSTCQGYIKNTKNQTVVKFTVVPCAPVVEVKIKRPNTKYQLGFSVQNGVICSLLRGGIAERGGVRVGHRIIEINNQSVVAVPHEKIVNLLATSVGEILMKTMPTSMFRLLTGQENPIYI
ncbi:uncharacterized protein LOC128277409 [Anopheles cruzii]|uniref:uncharacterized protein LOC128277409 n=1 Tax=Anopheles cruzii TaxID=68878 RepID=UPI0022EC964B|nr:uncharacterized protein LOC128277409 [Anopheles cruzii]